MVKNCDLCGKPVEKNSKTVRPYRTRPFMLKKKIVYQVVCEECHAKAAPAEVQKK